MRFTPWLVNMFGLIPLKAWLVAAVVAAVAALGLWLRHDAVQDERAAEKARQEQQDKKTLERINEAITDHRTPDDILERLRRLAE